MALELVRVWDFGQLVFRRSVGARHESCETSMNTSSVDEEVEDEDARLASLLERDMVPLKRPNLVPQSSFKFPSVKKYSIVSWAQRTLSHEGP